MTSETELIKLYSERILALATDIPHLERLKSPHATVKKRSPLCGSTVTVDIEMTDDKVSAFAQDVKACALGQAAASIVGSAIIGLTKEQVENARDELQAMLKAEGSAPHAPFDELYVLLPAKDYKNRHASIMLSLEATTEAIQQAIQLQSTQKIQSAIN